MYKQSVCELSTSLIYVSQGTANGDAVPRAVLVGLNQATCWTEFSTSKAESFAVLVAVTI